MMALGLAGKIVLNRVYVMVVTAVLSHGSLVHLDSSG